MTDAAQESDAQRSGSRCVFCQTTSGKRSGEHVLRRWFKGRIPTSVGLENYQNVAFREIRTRQIPMSPFDVLVNDVCKRCNESWLNDIEQAVGDLIVELANVRTTRVPEAQAAALATWAAKTALMMTSLDRSMGANAPPSLFAALFADPTTPPAGCRVQIGLTASDLFPLGRNQAALALTRDARTGPLSEEVKMHLVSFTLGTLFFQVSLASNRASDRDLIRAFRAGRKALPGRLHLLWPYEHPGDLQMPRNPLQDNEVLWASELLQNSPALAGSLLDMPRSGA